MTPEDIEMNSCSFTGPEIIVLADLFFRFIVAVAFIGFCAWLIDIGISEDKSDE